MATPSPLDLISAALAAPMEALTAFGKTLQTLAEIASIGAISFAGLGQKIKDVGIAIGSAIPTFGKLGEKLKELGGSVGALALGTAKAVGGLTALGHAMGVFVAKANPAVFEQFQLASNDLFAVIGQSLVPVFKLVTDVIRAFADTWVTFGTGIGQSIATVLKPLVEVLKVLFEVFGRIMQALGDVLAAVAPALNAVGTAFLEIVKALQPVIDLLVDVFGAVLVAAFTALASIVEAIAPFVMALARAFGDLLEWIARTVRELLAFVGVDIPDRPGTRAGASVGAAVRQAQIGDVTSVIQQAQKSAFSLGAASADPASRTASAAEELKKKADLIYEQLKEIIAWLKKPFEDIAKSISELTGDRVSVGVGESTLGGGIGFGEDESRLIENPAIAAILAKGQSYLTRRGGDGGGTVPPHGLGSR